MSAKKPAVVKKAIAGKKPSSTAKKAPVTQKAVVKKTSVPKVLPKKTAVDVSPVVATVHAADVTPIPLTVVEPIPVVVEPVPVKAKEASLGAADLQLKYQDMWSWWWSEFWGLFQVPGNVSKAQSDRKGMSSH